MSNAFSSANDIHGKVQSGEITGYVSWPVQDSCDVMEVGTEFKNGKPYLSVTLKHPAKGAQTFLVKIPESSEKDNVKFMGMQRLYGILYPIANATPGKHSPEQAFSMAVAELKEGPLAAQYVLREYDQLDQRTGKTYTNQSLESVVILEGEEGDGEFK